MSSPPAISEHSLDVLEFHGVLTQLAAEAMSAYGATRLQDLRPDAPLPARDRELVRDFIALREGGVVPHAARFPDPSEPLQRVAPVGAVLDAEEFLLLRDFLQAARAVETFLRSETCGGRRALRELVEFVAPPPELVAALDRVFDERGDVLDRASQALGEIRREITTLDARIHRKLEALLRDADLADALQEHYIAVRNNRYVVPVRREFRARIRGVVHDQSNTGRTLFMEPAAVLDDANDLAAARLEERDEIRRILAALSDDVRAVRSQLATAALAIGRYDAASAISAWARRYTCHYVERGPLKLIDARHPLLQAQLIAEGRGSSLVPMRLELDPETRVVAVTGPNTGGKTIVLKTIGLLTLLDRTGLPVPAAAASRLPGYATVLADIGDEQSIAQSLSTFSGHLRQIAAILAAAAPNTLVLLDELGAGTDPLEGGALGCAVLRQLAAAGATTLATTHLGVIKHFVHDAPGMMNACVRFNQDTLAPEYLLEVGRPGSSYALSIAKRLGLPESVLADAASMLGSDRIRLESLLAEMDEQQVTLSQQLQDAQTARDKAVAERETVRQELKDLRDERRRRLREAQAEAAAMVDRTRRQMEQLLSRAAKGIEPEEAKELRRAVEDKRDKLKKGLEATKPKPPERLDITTIAPGQKVWVAAFSARGTIVELSRDKSRATVDVDGLKLQVDVKDLGKPGDAADAPLERSNAGSAGHAITGPPAPGSPGASGGQIRVAKPPRTRTAKLELNLIGKRVEEALNELDTFLDDAALADLNILRVVHGFGTGALRTAIHEHLKTHPLVARFQLGRPNHDAGGGGATQIELRE